MIWQNGPFWLMVAVMLNVVVITAGGLLIRRGER